jgi:hypothetical protein
MAAAFPQHRIEAAEDGADAVIPAPQKVIGQLRKAREGRRQGRTYEELL